MASACLNDAKLNFDSGLTLNVNSCLESILSFEDNNYPPTISSGRKKWPVVMLPSLFPENNGRLKESVTRSEIRLSHLHLLVLLYLKIKEGSGDN